MLDVDGEGGTGHMHGCLLLWGVFQVRVCLVLDFETYMLSCFWHFFNCFSLIIDSSD